MRAGIIKNGVIVNIIVLDDSADPAMFNAVKVSDSAAVGDEIEPTDRTSVWDEMAAAYKEGVQEA